MDRIRIPRRVFRTSHFGKIGPIINTCLPKSQDMLGLIAIGMVLVIDYNKCVPMRFAYDDMSQRFRAQALRHEACKSDEGILTRLIMTSLAHICRVGSPPRKI